MYNSLLDSLYNGAINTIDTAPFWGYQRSERTVGCVLRKSILDRLIVRDEVFVTSRVGYIEVGLAHSRKTLITESLLIR